MASTKSKQDALIDELLKECQDPKDILGKNGLLKQLTKRLVERTLQAELTDHLGYEPHAAEGRGSGNCRNGNVLLYITTSLPLTASMIRCSRS
jgi:putative transposase